MPRYFDTNNKQRCAFAEQIKTKSLHIPLNENKQVSLSRKQKHNKTTQNDKYKQLIQIHKLSLNLFITVSTKPSHFR